MVVAAFVTETIQKAVKDPLQMQADLYDAAGEAARYVHHILLCFEDQGLTLFLLLGEKHIIILVLG